MGTCVENDISTSTVSKQHHRIPNMVDLNNFDFFLKKHATNLTNISGNKPSKGNEYYQNLEKYATNSKQIVNNVGDEYYTRSLSKLNDCNVGNDDQPSPTNNLFQDNGTSLSPRPRSRPRTIKRPNQNYFEQKYSKGYGETKETKGSKVEEKRRDRTTYSVSVSMYATPPQSPVVSETKHPSIEKMVQLQNEIETTKQMFQTTRKRVQSLESLKDVSHYQNETKLADFDILRIKIEDLYRGSIADEKPWDFYQNYSSCKIDRISMPADQRPQDNIPLSDTYRHNLYVDPKKKEEWKDSNGNVLMLGNENFHGNHGYDKDGNYHEWNQADDYYVKNVGLEPILVSDLYWSSTDDTSKNKKMVDIRVSDTNCVQDTYTTYQFETTVMDSFGKLDYSTIDYRYSELLMFHHVLLKRLKSTHKLTGETEWDFFEYRNLVQSLCAMFPPKCYFGGSMNKEVVMKRRKALERYFKSVLSVKELSIDLFAFFQFS